MLRMCRTRSVPTPKLPKTAIDRQEHRGNGTPRAPGVPRNATYIQKWYQMLIPSEGSLRKWDIYRTCYPPVPLLSIYMGKQCNYEQLFQLFTMISISNINVGIELSHKVYLSIPVHLPICCMYLLLSMYHRNALSNQEIKV